MQVVITYMEQILLEAAKQIPSLVVLVILVWMFNNHQQKTGEVWIATVKDLQRENLDARNAQRETIRENTAVAKENTIAMTKLTDAVEHLVKSA